MKRKLLIPALALIGLVAAIPIWVACGKNEAPHQEHGDISYYTCPMHHQIHMDKPGQCPICGMTLVPVYEEAPKSDSPTPSESNDSALPQMPEKDVGVTISPERQQLIGIKTALAEIKPFAISLEASGTVAYDPDLAIAEREYVEILQNNPSLKAAGRSRLQLLGLSEAEIADLERSRKPSHDRYLPDANDSVWVYATVYETDMAWISAGLAAEVSLPWDKHTSFSGRVESVDPLLNEKTRALRARIRVSHAGGILKPQTFVNVKISKDMGEVLTIPREAALHTGTRTLVFVKHGDGHFMSHAIEVGMENDRDTVVYTGLAAGDRVATNALFLIDSESTLKGATTETGGHQH